MIGLMELAAFLGAGGGAGLSGFTGYFVARRRYSGNIASTDADALWQEAGELRREYQTTIARITKEMTRLQEEQASKDEVIAVLQANIATQNARHMQEIAELRAEHTKELSQLRAAHTREIAELGVQYSKQIADLRTELSKREGERMALEARVEELSERSRRQSEDD